MQGGVKNTSLGDPNAFYFELDTQDVIIWLLKLIEAFSLDKTAKLIDDLAEVFFPDESKEIGYN